MRLITLLQFVLVTNYVAGQSIQFIGSVFDSESHVNIPYVNITIKNEPIGTITNINGDFVFNLPDNFTTHHLEFSCIGYKNLSLPIDSLISLDTLLIPLAPKNYRLKDVVIVPGKNDPKTIMRNVLRKIDNNYPGKKYYLEAFFRHKAYNYRNNVKTVRLTEAAVSILKNQHTKEDSKLQINEIRNSNNYVETNRESFGLRLFYKALYGERQNAILELLRSEKWVNKSRLRALIKDDNYSVVLKNVSFLHDTLVYVIEFKQQTFELLFKKYPVSDTYTIIRYFVNASDYATVKFEKFNISHDPRSRGYVKNDSIGVHIILQYKKFDNNYYLNYAYRFGPFRDQDYKLDSTHFYHHERELLVNELAVRRKDFDRIKYKNQVGKSIALWKLDYKYNPEFWKTYNVLLYNPLDIKSKKDLEFDVPLEEQFIKTK